MTAATLKPAAAAIHGESRSEHPNRADNARARLDNPSPNMVQNTLSNWLGLVVAGIVSFVLTPLLIHGLGTLYYGIWIVVGSLVDHSGLLDFGIRTAFFRFVARYHGMDDRAALNETFMSALAIMLGLGCLVVLMTGALATPIPSFLIPSGPHSTARALLLLLGLSSALSFPSLLLGSYLCAIRRFELYNLIIGSNAIAKALSFVAVLAAGLGVRGMGLALLCVTVLTLCLSWYLVLRADPALRLGFAEIRWHRIKEMTRFSLYAFINTAGEYLRTYSGALVAARVLGVSSVTPLNVATRLIEYLRQSQIAIWGPLMGAMSGLDGQSRQRDLQQFVVQATKVTMLSSVYIGTILALDGEALIRLWVGKDFAESYPLLLVLTVAYVVSFGQQPSVLVVFAKARHRFTAVLTLGEGLINLLLTIYLARRFGLIGVAVGTALPLLLARLVIQPWYARRSVGYDARQYWAGAIGKPLLASGVCLAISRSISYAPQNVIRFLMVVGLHSALFVGLSWFCLTARERRSLWDKFGAVFRSACGKGREVQASASSATGC